MQKLTRVLRLSALLGSIAALCCLPQSSHAADKLRVSNCYIGGAILPLWMAQDAGFYAREGLDVEQIWIQGNPAVASLISGEIDLLYCIPHNAIGAPPAAPTCSLSPAPTIACSTASSPRRASTRPSSKGKLLGIARIHDVPHFYVRLALRNST
jgi:ABC-type nitrate/sulfonate/bicarbonate transport system substrate-binding protein